MTNNAVQVSAGLSCTALSSPAIGMSASGSFAFTDGDTATDTYVLISTATALNADIDGGGYLLVQNPATINGVANTATCQLKISSTVIGTIQPGGCALLPLDSGTIVTGTASAGSFSVGVSVVECDPNA